jgi:spermidine/putrescine transport system substrate-binding protein
MEVSMSEDRSLPPSPSQRLSRRALLYRAGGAGVVLASSPLITELEKAFRVSSAMAGTSSSTTLNILTWQGYQDPKWLAEFKAKTGITVNQESVGAPAEMFAKVRANPGQYDVIFCTAGWFSNYVNDDLLIPIDESHIPNIKLISNVFPWRHATTVNGKSYGVLYNWGDVPLGWLAKQVPGSYKVDKYLNKQGVPWDWNILWDPQFKGLVSMFDSPTDVYPMIGLAAGLKNPYHLSPSGLALVKKKLLSLRPQIKRLTSGFNDQTNQFVSKEAVIGYLNNALVTVDVNKAGVPFKANHVMKQGTPAWSDNASITKQGGAKKLDAVYKFIDYELSIPWQARFVAASGNDGTISHAQATSKQAKAAGLTPSKLAVTLIPQTRDPKFFPSLVFYQSTNVLKQELDIWNDFKLGIH